jgi:dTDP-glucose 4,6-dehydratase
MNLLITGGMGFIGSNFIKYILKRYPKIGIINIDKMSLGANPENLRSIEKLKNYRFIGMNILDFKKLNKIVEGIDAIINFAAETHVDRSIADPEPFVRSNILGTYKILEAIRKYNESINYVQISTDETYGEIFDGSFNEFNRLHPSNPYSATKASADMLCLAYIRTYGLNIKITRCTNNFGPYQFPEKLIPKTIIRAHMKLPIPVYGEGTNLRDWIYVRDHCEALTLILKKGRPGEIYNISTNEEFSNVRVVKEIIKLLGRTEDLITFVEDRPGHDKRYSLNSSKIRLELNWKPRYSFLSALRKTVKWYLKNESWWKPFASQKVLSPTPWLINRNSKL